MTATFMPRRTVVLDYGFPDGAAFPAARSPAGLRTQYPAFEQGSLRRAGYPQALSWEHDTMQPANRLTLGPSGGPTAYAAPGFRSVLVVSPLDHFMTSAAADTAVDGSNTTAVAAWGTAATVRSVPPGFVHRIVLHEGRGLTQTIHEYGQLMQAVAAAGGPGSRSRSPSGGITKIPDITLRKLGYSTDNGAMYCYCKEHCDTTLLAVKAAWDTAGIPMAYLTFEGSWCTPAGHSHCAPPAAQCPSRLDSQSRGVAGAQVREQLERDVVRERAAAERRARHGAAHLRRAA